MPRSAPKEQRAGSDSDDEDLCLAYSKRVGWKDVIPIAQPETANPIVSIDYRPEYVDVMNYFRAVFVSGEVSRRVLDLTADAIAMNGANYTVWHRRWEVVEAMVEMERNGERSGGEMSNGGGGEMSVDDAMDDDNDTSNPSLLDHEFAYTAKLCLANPKNYQVWNHMRLVSAALGAKSSARNLAATKNALDQDSKNIHAWTHRSWCVRAFSLWKEELAFTEQKIEQDVRNNSAWTERFVVAFGVWDDCGGDTKRERGSDDFSKIVTDEIAFAETRIAMAPDNESAWSYLRGIARLSACRYDRNIQTRVEGIARGFARGFSDAKLEAESVDGAGEKNDVDVDATASQKTCRQALSFLCEILGDSAEKELMLKTLLEIDPIRGNYWAWKSGGGAAC